MPDGIILNPSPTRDAGLEKMWAAIGERYADVLKADRTYGDSSKQADRATDRWFAAERKIINVKGTDAAVLLMKLELVAGAGNISQVSGDFVCDAVRGMIRDLRALLGDAAPVPYSALVKAEGE